VPPPPATWDPAGPAGSSVRARFTLWRSWERTSENVHEPPSTRSPSTPTSTSPTPMTPVRSAGPATPAAPAIPAGPAGPAGPPAGSDPSAAPAPPSIPEPEEDLPPRLKPITFTRPVSVLPTAMPRLASPAPLRTSTEYSMSGGSGAGRAGGAGQLAGQLANPAADPVAEDVAEDVADAAADAAADTAAPPPPPSSAVCCCRPSDAASRQPPPSSPVPVGTPGGKRATRVLEPPQCDHGHGRRRLSCPATSEVSSAGCAPNGWACHVGRLC
jgi:hypothetical protein